MIVTVMLAMMTTAPSYSSKSPEIVRWVDMAGHIGVHNQLSIERGGSVEAGYLQISCESVTDGATWTTTRSDSLKNAVWSEWKLAVPIAVVGDSSPQVLAKLYRPNWLDFVIYIMAKDGVGKYGIEKVFSFSCRDERAIKWNVVSGKLESIETFDRYETVPERLEVKEELGHRWILRSRYRYEPKSHDWVRSSQRWEQTTSEKAMGGSAIMTKGDCGFLFSSRE